MCFLINSLVVSTLWSSALAVARFEPTTVSDTSLVIKMIKGNNVSSFDMTVQIFDLDRLFEYRKTELRDSTKDQLFSFDGLTKSTWFAFRIHYHLYYDKPASDKTTGYLKTKQELIVRTKDSAREDRNKINDTVAYIDDLFITKDNVYIGVASVFKDTKKVSTIIVPEMRCNNGILKPVTQQVIHHASFHFDLTILGDSNKSCSKICVYPYVRVTIQNNTSETFRAKEWCGGIEEARRLVQSSAHAFCIFSLLLSFIVYYANLRV